MSTTEQNPERKAGELQAAASTTAVGRWLKENGADGATIQAFYDQEYTDLEDVTADVIDEIVREKKGLASKLKRLLAQKNKPKKDPVQPMPPPDLPAGEAFDLTAPMLQHTDVKFEVPSALSVEPGEKPKRPAELTDQDWMVIAKYSKFIYGFDMSGPAPERPREPVLWWKVPAEDETFVRNEEDHATVSSDVTFTSETASYVKAGFDKEQAKAGYAGCSASFERTHKEKHAQSMSRTRRYMIGRWVYPRATIFLDACTTVSPRFVAAVEKALGATNPKQELEKTLKRFGHVVPSEVLLGGQLVLTASDEADSSASEDEQSEVIAAAVSIKIGGAEGSAGTTTGTSTSTKRSAEDIAQKTRFEAVGGDDLLTSNPSKWAASLADANWWTVIENHDITPTLYLLPNELKARALEYWPVSDLEPVSDLTLGVAKAATTDGFVFGDVTIRDHGDRGSIALYSDSKRDPQTVRASASCHFYTPNDQHIHFASFFTPVRRGDSCVLRITPTSGNPWTYAKMQAFDLGFGEWQKLEIGKTYPSADRDGFVMGLIGVANGPRGVLYGEQGSQPGELDCWVSSAVHHNPPGDTHIPVQSFCMPVLKNNAYRVRLEASTGTPYADAYWIAVNGSFKFRQPDVISTNTVYQADANGIVFGYMYGGSRSRGTTYLRVADDLARIDEGQVGETRIHDFEGGDRWIKRNSVTRVVRKGQWYKAHVQTDDPNFPVAAAFRWLPIVPA